MIPSMLTNPGAPPNPSLFTTIQQASQIQAAMIDLYKGVFCQIVDMAPGLTNGQGGNQWGVITPGSPFPADCGFLLSHVTLYGSWATDANNQPYWKATLPPVPQQPTPVPSTPVNEAIPGISDGTPVAAPNAALFSRLSLFLTKEGF